MVLRDIYNDIEFSIRNYNLTLRLNTSITIDELHNIIYKVMLDNPDIFWFSHQYHYEETYSTIHFQYTFSSEKVKAIQHSIKDVIDNDFCLGYVKTLTRQEQIVYIYKWLATYSNYNEIYKNNNSIYSVFVLKKSESTGYAKAAQYIFNLLGIESVLVFGKLQNDEMDVRYCWNLVKVDNNYYHFDACFGDSTLDYQALNSGVQELFKIEEVNYCFLCISTYEISKTRIIEDIITLPVCHFSWPKDLIKSLVRTTITKERLDMFHNCNRRRRKRRSNRAEMCADSIPEYNPIISIGSSISNDEDILNNFTEDNSMTVCFDMEDAFDCSAPIIPLDPYCDYDESCSESYPNFSHHIKRDVSYEPLCIRDREVKLELHTVYSSIFAPTEVKRKSHLQVQVYLHLYEEAEKVKTLAKESDKNADRRDYIPLSLKLRNGDKVDIEFNIYGETRLMTERKSIIWQGSFTKCSFNYFIPKDINIDELSCETNLFVNGAMIGDMRFITRIVEVPRNLNTQILSHRFNKIFISYAHQDAQQIKLFALAYKAQGIDYFYDRDSLKPGDVYEEKIFEYIDSSDLFVLCWSKNAAVSDYVAKEKERALLRAYPQLGLNEATLKICPISIEPRADLPSDMKGVYNFEVL